MASPGRRTAPVTTGQIYWGAVPFVLIQIVMVGLIIAFPGIVSGGLASKAKVDIQNIHIQVPAEGSTPGVFGFGDTSVEQDAATKALERAMRGAPAEKASGARQ